MRGAERTFAEISECWPEAPVYTSLYDEDAMPRFAGRQVHTSKLQRFGARQDNFRRLLPLYPAAMRSFDLSDFDLVVSSSSAFAHGVRVGKDATHVCYCYTPFRYAWHERQLALDEVGPALRFPVNATLGAIRRWDLAAARKVDHYIAISRISQRRIRDAYGVEAPVVHPPVEIERFTPTAGGEYALIVCELVAHKRVDVALEGIRSAGLPAVVVGSGPERERLSQEHPDVHFAGRVSDEQLARLYENARAVVVPSFEEFGIVAVEAQASGTPVVAPTHGGAAETVRDGVTGVLLEWVRPETIAQALQHEVFETPDVGELRRHAERFSSEAFRTRLVEAIEHLTGMTVAADMPIAA